MSGLKGLVQGIKAALGYSEVEKSHGGQLKLSYAKPGDEKGTTFDPKGKPYKKPAKWFSAGGVIVPSMDDTEHVYLIKPSHGYGPWAFPKGRTEHGEKMTTTAMREVEEETGIQAQPLPGGYLGSGEGSYSITHYWLMVQTGGNPGNHDQEVEEVRLCSFEEAEKLFRGAGNHRDVEILKRAISKLKFIKEHHPKHAYEYEEHGPDDMGNRMRVLLGILGPHASWHR